MGQVFCGILIASGTLWYQVHLGLLSGNDAVRENLEAVLVPYAWIVGGFILLNAGRTMFLYESRKYRIKRRSERRAAHKSELMQLAIASPPPNLQCGKFEFLLVELVSNDYHLLVQENSGSSALILAITNDVPASGKVAYVGNITAKLYFFSTAGDPTLLDTVEKACWLEDQPVHFAVGSTNHLVLLFTGKYERTPRALERVHGPIKKRPLPDGVSDVVISLTSPGPVYNKRFHIKLGIDYPSVCNDTSCTFCQEYVIRSSD